jgi:hypothetical protein
MGGSKAASSELANRSDAYFLRAVVIGAGLCWSVAFVVLALCYELELYADGAMFSYAVATQDVWAFHWHNISGRMSVFLLCLLPAEIYVGLTGNPGAGIVAYGMLFYLAPLAGLIGTFAADRSSGRIIFVYACFSTALLCPLIFGFPTEMWLAHAIFWPTLAVSHFARRSATGTALVFVMMLALAFTHEGALVLVFAIVATTAPRGWRDASFLRAAAVLISILATSAAAKIMLPPDEYYAPHHFSGEHRRAVVRGTRRIRRCLPGAFAIDPTQRASLCRRHRGNNTLDILAMVRPHDPCEQPLLSTNGTGDRYTVALRAGGAARHAHRWLVCRSIIEPATGDGCAEWPRGPATCSGVYPFDVGACDRDSKIRRGMEAVPDRSRLSRDE